MPSIPKGLAAADSKQMQQRRKTAIRTFEAMSVLDMSKAIMMDKGDGTGGGGGGGKGGKNGKGRKGSAGDVDEMEDYM